MKNGYGTQSRAETLKGRAKRCVCKHCGSKLEIRMLVFSEFKDARTEIFCPVCDRIEFGVEPEIYNVAKYFVDSLEFQYYHDMDDNERTRKMNIAKVCEVVSWSNKHLGLLNEKGFQVPVTIADEILGECFVITDEQLRKLEGIE